MSQSMKCFYLDKSAKSKMEDKKALEERLREVCCIGDERNTKLLIERGININAANAMNGWTPLHWAAKRGHASIVKYLVQEGADTTLLTKKGETAAQVSSNTGIKQILGEEGNIALSTVNETLPIVPNYLRNPEFFYAVTGESGRLSHAHREQSISNINNQELSLRNGQQQGSNTSSNSNSSCAAQPEEEIVLRLRIADSEEKDFIEVDLNRRNLPFQTLENVCCEELGIDATNVKKIRKLPNTIVRNDKDMTRLLPFQELEVVLTCNKS